MPCTQETPEVHGSPVSELTFPLGTSGVYPAGVFPAALANIASYAMPA